MATKTKKEITEEFIRAVPKSDLHVHLDGSLRASSRSEMSREQKLELPSMTEEGLYDLVFKERYQSLNEYLEGFQYTTAVMQTPESLSRVASELAMDNFEEGVRYIEPRFAPQLHINQHQTFTDVVLAVNRGLRRAADEINNSEAIRSGEEPKFQYGIIVCALRMFNEHFSDYYAKLLAVHPHTPPVEVYGMSSMDLARATVKLRQEYGLPIVGFDLAGQENGYPAADHVDAFQFAHENFMKKTVHAGEAYGPESIFQAITDLHADRVGHGYHLFSPWLIADDSIPDKQTYTRDLARYIADRRITLEVCLTSNIQTNPRLKKMVDHAFREMWKSRLSIAICTDNRLMSRTSVSKELMLAVTSFGLTVKDVRHLVIYGFKRSFFPGTYAEKRTYVRSIIDYYEAKQEEFFGADAEAN